MPPSSDAPSDRLGGRLLAVRPLGVSDILDGAFRGWRATFLPAALLVVILIGPLQLLLNLALTVLAPELGTGGLGDIFNDFDEPPETFEVPGAFVGVTFIGGILGFLITLVVSAAVVSLVLQVDRGERPDTGSSIREAARVLGTTLGASLLLIVGATLVAFAAIMVVVLLSIAQPVVGVLFGFLVLFPAAVILGAAFFGMTNMIVPIAVIERRGVLATIGRAFWVVRHRFWRVVGISLLVGLLVGIVGLIFQLPFSFAAFFLGNAGWVLESIGQILAQVISIPVTVLAIMLVYLDARVRLEGLDLQLRARWFGRS